MVSIIASLSLLSLVTTPAIDVSSLLSEMSDLAKITRRPRPSYSEAQASSYDRDSKTPGNEAWFANGDAGKFIRIEDRSGRKEYVMADLRGPGAVVRIWSANPNGVIRFYFDGEPEARFAWKMADLLGGKQAEFPSSLSYFSARGANLYFPFPYAKSLKITVDDSLGDGVKGLYYHVGHRTYAPTTPVTSLTREALESARPAIAAAAQRLSAPYASAAPAGSTWSRQRFDPLWFDQSFFQTEGASGAVYAFRLRVRHLDPPTNLEDLAWDDPRQMNVALRKLRLVAQFDGETCVDVPVADFFCSAGGARAFATLPIQVDEDGWMTCRFVMPYAKSANLRLVQQSGPRLAVEAEVQSGPYAFGADSYHFRAQWLSDRLHTRPMRDMDFLNVRGEGLFVGVGLHVANPTGAWWGEGDEKVFVDQEAFPSTFGTGTEDYFGYAWCDPTPFTRAFHAQPRCDGPGNRGHTNVVRWQTFDPIPFRNGLTFQIELWHWAEVTVDYDRVAYWYSPPGSPGPAEVDPAKLYLTYIPGPAPVKGALEGETAPIVLKSGGTTEIQDFGELSRGKQLWWRDANLGDKLVLEFEVAEAGTYEVSGNFCHARDYGRHRLALDGQTLQNQLDFYSPALEWRIVNLGVAKLNKGKVLFEVECRGHRQEALPRNMFGLDYLLLKKVE